MGKMAGKKKDKVSTVILLKRNKSNESQPIVIEKDYRRMLEEQIKEKILTLGSKEPRSTGKLRENLDKKKRWMGELLNAILEIKDILEKTRLIKVIHNDRNKLIIKTIDFNELKIVKTGFKLDIEFFERSAVLNNKKDCYLMQLLGKDVLQYNVRKFYDINKLMEFIINYCSEYIAECSLA